jgi:solute carrier organic anion transporter family, member 5A
MILFLISGMIIVAGCMFLTSCIMFMFPKNLHNNSSKVSPVDNIEEMTEMTEKNHEVEKLRKDEENPKLETNDYDDKNELFIPTIKRHITNKVFMLRTFSAVFHLLPITGLYVFLPRYLETQFLMPANQASFFAGTFGILAMGVGISLAGIISAKYQTTPKQFAKWVVVSTFLTIVGFGILMLVGCSMDNYKGLAEKSDSDGL